MPGSHSRNRSGAKAPVTAANCPEAEFITTEWCNGGTDCDLGREQP
jgi:hypothetical protein